VVLVAERFRHGARIVNIEANYREGIITEEERYKNVVQTWQKTTDDVTKALQEKLDEFNPIYMMADSAPAVT
jgi:DNA-directed RNA polymerase subunit beta'